MGTCRRGITRSSPPGRKSRRWMPLSCGRWPNPRSSPPFGPGAGNWRLSSTPQASGRRPAVSSAAPPPLSASFKATGRQSTCAAGSAARTGLSAGCSAFTAATRTPPFSASFPRKAGARTSGWRCATSATAISRWFPALPPALPKNWRSRTSPPFTWTASRRSEATGARVRIHMNGYLKQVYRTETVEYFAIRTRPGLAPLNLET